MAYVVNEVLGVPSGLPKKPKQELPLQSKDAIRMDAEIVRGVVRGHDLVERFGARLEGILGFRPYYGTLNVRIETPIDMEDFETKRVEHILLDGSRWIDTRMAPIKLFFKDKIVDAWFIVEEKGLHEDDVLEVIHKERLSELLGIKQGDKLAVELFPHARRGFKSRFKGSLRSLWPKAPRVIR